MSESERPKQQTEPEDPSRPGVGCQPVGKADPCLPRGEAEVQARPSPGCQPVGICLPSNPPPPRPDNKRFWIGFLVGVVVTLLVCWLLGWLGL